MKVQNYEGLHFDLSLVIACYNEESVLEDSMRQVWEILDNTRWTYEVIFVDDCSRDRTREIIDQLIASHPECHLSRIFHQVNTGRGGTVSDGIRAARGDVVGFIDIDLEVPARYIPSCVLAIQNGSDIASARRIYTFQLRSAVRYAMSKGYVLLMRSLLGVNLRDTETGFKFFKRNRILPILDEIEDKRWFWDTEVMVRSYLKGYVITEIPCLFLRRFDKRSSVNDLQDTIDYCRKLWRFRRVVAVDKGEN